MNIPDLGGPVLDDNEIDVILRGMGGTVPPEATDA